MTKKFRENEKGSAMVMAILITFLLLTASIGLVLEASTNTQNVTDLVAEQQAYHAAESGIQSAVHILRCQKNERPGCEGVAPAPLLNTSQPATHEDNQIDYIKAVDSVRSNIPSQVGDEARLSRWLNYSDTCGTGSVPCVPLNQQGYSFSLELSDPDNTDRFVSYSISGKLFENSGTDEAQMIYERNPTDPGVITPDKLIIKYVPPTDVVNKDFSELTGGIYNAPDGFGKFEVTRVGAGQVIPADNRFEIRFRMTQPYYVVKTIRGYIKATTSSAENPRIVFDSQTLTIAGSALTLNLFSSPSTNWTAVNPPIATIGYEAKMTLPGAGATLNHIIGGTVSKPEPVRVLIKSTGYGPRGAKKQLQAIIRKNFFNGLTAPAALTLVGPFSTTNPASRFYFSAGSSARLVYSGVDLAQGSTDIIPPIGTTDGSSLDCVENYVLGEAHYRDPSEPCYGTADPGNNPFNGTIDGSPSDISTELPYWLESPQELDREIHAMKEAADKVGRYFPNGSTPTSWGDPTVGTGITFCDGDVELGQGITGNGGGILVVTGALTLKGSFTFNGIIIVTGAGGVRRSGGGDGIIQGNVIVAPYVNSKIVDVAPSTDLPAGGWLAPRFDMDGGGTSTLQFNSESLANGLTAVSNFVLGVMEK